MTHALTILHNGGHLYGPGGIGEREFDPATLLLEIEAIAETRDLPGFSADGVTYESHHFWVHFCQYKRDGRNTSEHRATRRYSSVLIRVNHGGGWEVWRGDYMLAAALDRYGDDDRGLFWLCWYLIDNAREAESAGYARARREYSEAFVDGRLKRRKHPAKGIVKVWIEPKKESEPA